MITLGIKGTNPGTTKKEALKVFEASQVWVSNPYNGRFGVSMESITDNYLLNDNYKPYISHWLVGISPTTGDYCSL